MSLRHRRACPDDQAATRDAQLRRAIDSFDVNEGCGIDLPTADPHGTEFAIYSDAELVSADWALLPEYSAAHRAEVMRRLRATRDAFERAL